MTARLRLTGLALLLAAAVSGIVTSSAPARADGTAQTLPFTQNWTANLITANDNWTGVPGIIGYLGDDAALGTAVDPQTIVIFGTGQQDVIAQALTTSISGGVGEFDGLANPVVGLQGSGGADFPFILLHLDTTGFASIQVAYNLRDIDGTSDNAIQPVALQFRVGSSGNFTNVPAGFVADATTGPSQATLVTPVSATLPAAANNQPLVQVRIITSNAVGNDEWVGIDDITVTGTPPGPSGTGAANPNPVVAGNSTLLTVATVEGTPPSPIVSVVANLTLIGGSDSQPFVDDGTGGDVTSGDGIYSYNAFVPSDTTAGTKLLPATITDAAARTGTATISLDVIGPTPPSGVGAASPSILPVGESTTLTVTVTPGANPASTGLDVVADLSSVNGPSSQPFFDDGTNGDVTSGDNVFTYFYTVPVEATPGPKSLPATITDDQGRAGNAGISLTLTAAVAPVVISQVYGAGGNSGATFRNDFIELFNPSTTPADLTGWSVQYESATGGGTWQVTPLSGTLQPGRYYLVQQAGGANGAGLPAPDATGTISLASGAGKVLLIRTTSAQAGNCPTDPLIRDLVGYGPTADCFEGSGPAVVSGTPTTRSTVRLISGCTDTDNNAGDFGTDAVSPRNTSSPPVDCSVPPPAAPLHPISAIQGSGSTSPLANQLVRARGIVTGRTSNLYFLQTPDGDADDDGNPATSEGLLVFTGGTPTVTVGQFVETTGTVTEFIPGADIHSPPKTEITQNFVTIFSSGNPLPAPVTLTSADTPPSGPIEQLEEFEGMRVRVPALVVSAPSAGNVNEPNATSTNTGVFYGVVTGIARPFREPGIEVPDPVPPPQPPNVPRFDANPERIRVDSDLQPGAIALAVATGDTVTEIVGPLDYSFRTYTIAPDPAAPPQVTPGTPPPPPPAPAANQFSVASYNVERFFDTVNDPISEPVLTPAAFAGRLNKLSLFVRNILHTPDIIGLQEVENLSTLQAIAAKINGDVVAGGGADPAYQAYLVEGNDVGGIDVGFLVKSARVSVIDVVQEGKDATYIDPNTGQPAVLNDRPSLVLRAMVDAPASAPDQPVTVIVNHLRSLSGVDDPVDGNRIRTKRRAQAEFLAQLIQQRQVAFPQERLVVVGDLNAFGFNDGYGDSVGTIKGQPTPPDEVVMPSVDMVEPDLVNLEDLAPADQRYSFLFDGNAQTLDHALVKQSTLGLVAALHRGRGNADSPDTYRNDVSRPERLADHDPLVVYFNFPTQTQTALVSSQNPSGFGQPVTFTATVTAGASPVTAGSVTFRDGTTVLGTVDLNGSGQAAVTTSSLGTGLHSITAQFNGSGVFDFSSAGLTQTVQAAATTTVATSDVNPSGFTQPVTLTATVTAAGNPVTQGTVTFRDGGVFLAGPLPLNGAGQASFTISTLSVGSHSITASYSGTVNFGVSSGGFTQTVQPGVRVNDVFVAEGNAPGTMAAVFNVSLTAASAQAVTVSFATQDGTATAGSDYTARSGQVTFTAGATSRTVVVVILGDLLNEADETLSLMLPAAKGAIVLDSQGAATLINDDPLPALAIQDVHTREPQRSAVFTLRLSAPSGRDVAVDFETSDGTATAPADYGAASGTVTFPAGTVTRTVTVTVVNDGIPEPAENFFMVLHNVANAALADGLAVATIKSAGAGPGGGAADKGAAGRR